MSQLATLQMVFVAISFAALAVTPLLRGAPGYAYWVPLCVAVLVGNLGEWFHLIADGPLTGYAAERFAMLGAACIGVLFYLLVRMTLGFPPLRPRRRWALCIVPCLTLLGAFLYPMRQSRTTANALAHAMGLVDTGRELFHGIHLIYAFFMFLAAWVLVARQLAAGRLSGRGSVLMLAAVLLPTASVLTEIILAYLPFNPTSCALAVSLGLLGFYMARHKGRGAKPVMQGDRIENISDAYLLVDERGRLVDRNERACRYFPDLRDAPIGTPVSEIRNLPPAILQPGLVANEIHLRVGREDIYLRSSASIVKIDRGKPYICLILYDITELHRTMAELGEKANRDALTGLYNRIAFRRIATRDLRLALRTQQPASVLMLDLDHFKAVNDHYGHPAGDRVLVDVSGTLKKRLRSTDVIGRYGGEEFCVFLPDTEQTAAVTIAEFLRRDIETLRFDVGGQSFTISVSIGVATLNSSEVKTLDQLMAEADEHMYGAKTSGRNKVMA